MPNVPSHSPYCPNCWYDLSGEAASWSALQPARCPLEITCSECGRTFASRDVVRLNSHLPGFWEHEPGDRLVGAFARTLGWLVIPNRFWARLRWHHEVRPKRLVAWVLGVPAVLLLLAMPVRAISFVWLPLRGIADRYNPSYSASVSDIYTLPFGTQRPYGSDWYDAYFLLITFLPYVVVALVFPVALLAWFVSQRDRKRAGIVARAAPYGLVVFIFAALLELGYAIVVSSRVIVHPLEMPGMNTITEPFVSYEAWRREISTSYPMVFLKHYFFYAYMFWLAWYWHQAMAVGCKMREMWPWVLIGIAMLVTGVAARIAIVFLPFLF